MVAHPPQQVISVWGPAEEAGIQPMDFIQTINGRPVPTLSDFRETVHNLPVGEPVIVEVERGDQVCVRSPPPAFESVAPLRSAPVCPLKGLARGLPGARGLHAWKPCGPKAANESRGTKRWRE